jgi:hypothetical protein
MASKKENVKPAEEAVKAADAEVKKAAPAKKAPAKKAAPAKAKEAPAKKAPEKKAAAPKKAPAKKAAETEVIIQSPMGGEITPEAVLAKVGAVDKVYIRVDVNKAYWVKGEEYGAVDLW